MQTCTESEISLRRTGEPTTEYSKEAARKEISEILAQLKDIEQKVMVNYSMLLQT